MTIQRVETVYDGPVRESTMAIAGRSIILVRPAEPDRMLDDPEVVAWNSANDYMPYWAYLWPGALLLAEAVAADRPPDGTSVLELGCGLGLPGLVAVALGLRVHFTDYDLAPLRFVERSARANGFAPSSYSASLLDWRDPPENRYPLILGADVTYERRLVPLVAQAIANLLTEDGVALISDPNRAAAEGFAGALASHGLAIESTLVATETEEFGPVQGVIYRVRRPGRA